MGLKGNQGSNVTRNRPLERLRGMDDLLPAATRQVRHLMRRLGNVAESFGYQPIDVPLLESTELFTRKSGEALIPQLYAFDFRHRDVCLRPEFTASVGRLFVDHLQDAPVPQRLWYFGPVFRYEKPQRGRRRQFTQVGSELIGASGPLADAEIILAACEGLNALGMEEYRVVLGHLGATLEILQHLKLDRRARDFLLTNLENLSRDGRGFPYIEAKLAELFPSGPSLDIVGLGQPPSGAGRAQARSLLVSLLDRLEADMALGGRPTEEIVESVLDRLSRPDQEPMIREALNLVQQLAMLSGAPDQTLPAAAELLARHQLSDEPLRELEQIVRLLREAGLPDERLTINLGFGRGLHYYTGMIFEIYSRDSSGDDQQLCGGGRYDDLITSMGGRKRTPACGFAYGIERVAAHLPSREPITLTDVLIGLEDDDLGGFALRMARRLRSAGLKVENDVRQRTMRANLQYAAKAGIPFVVTVRRKDVSASYELVDRATGESRTLSAAELGEWADTIGKRGK